MLGDPLQEALPEVGELDAGGALLEAELRGRDDGVRALAAREEGLGASEADEPLLIVEVAGESEEIHRLLGRGDGAVDLLLGEEREREDGDRVGAGLLGAGEDADRGVGLARRALGVAAEQEDPGQVGAGGALHPRVALRHEGGHGLELDRARALDLTHQRERQAEVVLGDGGDLRKTERRRGLEGAFEGARRLVEGADAEARRADRDPRARGPPPIAGSVEGARRAPHRDEVAAGVAAPERPHRPRLVDRAAHARVGDRS
jgi:hypothetical protein